ncbi:CHAT domain-containing tetratricopeptide repeat protein [Seonamhaeicola sp.]|uniref:CHAT domain-containing protein n=1 Tax=Seonamhaeicola sp. TaxID=1912245 RepID=UPI0026249AF8|nr:CHAT domain-containing tetratricopeptide repeat protein [Seonamhaeicola sp.]
MKPFTKLLFVLALITADICFGQTEKDTLIAFQYYQKADSLLTVKKFDESIALFEKALPVYQKAKVWERVASCYNKLSENQRRIHELEKSVQNANKALSICDTFFLESNAEEANAYENLGAINYYNVNYNICLSYLQRALSIRKKILPEYDKRVLKSYSDVAFMYKKIKKLEQAITYYEKALEISIKIYGVEHYSTSSLYGWIGATYLDMEKHNIALKYYNKFLAGAIKNKKNINIAHAYMNIGVLYTETKRLDLALEQLEKALSIFKRENKIEELYGIYMRIGYLYINKGEYNKSLQYFRKSLDIEKSMDMGDRYHHLGTVYEYIGYVYYYQKDYEKSLYYNAKALEVFKRIFGENYYRVSTCYALTAGVLMKKKEYKKALIYFNKSLKINRNIFGDNSSRVARTYMSLGLLYTEQEDYDTALKYYQKSLQIIQNTSSDVDILISLYISFGKAYIKLYKFQEALIFFNKAIECNTKKRYIKIYKNKFDPDHYHNLKELFRTLAWKAKTLQEHYKIGKNSEDLDKSIFLYRNLDRLTDYIRQSYLSYKDKVNLARQVKVMYTYAITAQLLKYRATKDYALLEKVRYYAERSKSNTLKNLLLDHSAKNFSELPEELLKLESALKSNSAYYQSCITAEQTKDSVGVATVQEYEDKLFDVNRRQDSLTQVLEQEYPKYFQLKHDNKVITVSEIQERLDKNTTLLEFFTTDSTTYAFGISKNKLAFKELQTLELDDKIEVFRKAITSKDLVSYKQLGNELYNTLIHPLKETLVGNELIIIPDGSLWHLNFDLLLTKEDTSEAPSDLPYLLRDYAISYANSATLLLKPFQDKKQKAQQEGCLAFSFSDSTSVVEAKPIRLAALRDTAEDLPGTRKEIKAIADIIDGQYYFGSDADEANFKKNAGRYKVLHLALHGDVDNERPENSKLYFTKSKDTIEDSYLYGHELFALNIPTELTVLSACNTGTGKIAKGEGIMSLGHAFQYAGTKSLLLSSWEVPDETTPELMKYFYTNLKSGMNKSKALQQAKLQYLEQADIYKAAPFYWGGFYLVGDKAPIDFGMDPIWYWVIGLVFLAVLTGVIFLGRKNKRIPPNTK